MRDKTKPGAIKDRILFRLENLNIYFENIGIKCFDYWYFSCIQRKNEIHLQRHCKSHIVFGPWYFEISAYFY